VDDVKAMRVIAPTDLFPCHAIVIVVDNGPLCTRERDYRAAASSDVGALQRADQHGREPLGADWRLTLPRADADHPPKIERVRLQPGAHGALPPAGDGEAVMPLRDWVISSGVPLESASQATQPHTHRFHLYDSVDGVALPRALLDAALAEWAAETADDVPEHSVVEVLTDPFRFFLTVRLPADVPDGPPLSTMRAVLKLVVPDAPGLVDLCHLAHCQLKSVSLPASVTFLGNSVFENCTLLISADMSAVANVSKLSSMFFECAKLRVVKLPPKLTKIGRWSFCGCRALTSVHLPASLTEIDKHAFEECTSLALIEFPHGLKRISKGAFKNCTGLTNVNLPSSLQSIHEFAFQWCTPNIRLSTEDPRVQRLVSRLQI
jgi:hypothetical protein